MKNFILIVTFIINGSFVLAQATPGNIGTTNLTAWFKATDLANGNVTSWTTNYPTGAGAITVTEAGAPYPIATNTPAGNTSNYNTTIYFDTTNLVENIGVNLRALETNATLNLLDNNAVGEQGTFFGNAYFPKYYNNNDHMMMYNEASGSTSRDGIQYRNLGANGRFAIGRLSSGISPNANRDWAENYLPTTISYSGNRSTATTMNQYENSMLNTNNPSSQISGNVGLRFGYKVGSATSQYKGFLNEFIFFNRDLSNNEMLRIDSYLAVKYGITLDNTSGGTQGDYLATNSIVIWDANVNSAYHNNVIAIGRDDSEALEQKQSHSFYDSTRIYIDALAATNIANTGSFSNDISYIMVGENQGELCHTPGSLTEIPGTCGLYSRVEREWKVTKTNITDNFSMDVTLNVCGNQLSVTVSHLRLLVDDDGDFSNGGTTCYFNGDAFGTVISYSNPIITVTGISNTHIANNSTRYITIGSTNSVTPLPVELSNFDVNCENNNPELTWSTSSEINNDYFTVERSSDGINFEAKVTVNGNGNSSTPINYKWIDDNPINGTVYYRLKQTDFNGEFGYHGIKTITCEQGDAISVYPNPFENSFTVQLSQHLTYPITVEVLDYLGRKVHVQILETSATEIVLDEHIPSGTYFVKVVNETTQVVERVIKMNYY